MTVAGPHFPVFIPLNPFTVPSADGIAFLLTKFLTPSTGRVMIGETN